MTFKQREHCDLETRNNDMNNTALHHGILWAAVNSVHYLLFKGANFEAISGDGLNPIDLAERRMKRLSVSTELSEEEKSKAMRKTIEILNVLREVRVSKSYRAWARAHTKSPYVAKYYPEFVVFESRQKLCLIRRLCLNKRAKMLKKKQYRVREAKRIEKHREQMEKERLKLKPKYPPLVECLERDGLEKGWARDLKFFNVTTVDDAAKLSLSDIGMLGDLNRAEKRELWMWIKGKQNELKDFINAGPTKNQGKVKISADAVRFMDPLRLCMCESKMPEDAFGTIVKFLY